MSTRKLQFDCRIIGPTSIADLAPVTAQWRNLYTITVQRSFEAGGCQALTHQPLKLRSVLVETPPGEERRTPEGQQEILWQGFFSDPAQWWDNRRSKRTPRHPDFRHKKSKEVLWVHNRHNPPWVESQLATWDAEMNRFPNLVPASVQGASGSLAEEDLEIENCRKLCETGKITEAVEALDSLVQRGCHVPNNLFYRVLKRCITHKDLVLGRRIHALTVKSGYEGDAFLATHLIGLYASHGKLEEAMRVFAKVSTPDAYNWATIIFAYARHGEPTQAIRLYRQMRESTVEPDNHIFLAVLKACATARDLAAGKDVHAQILASAGKPDLYVQNSLVHMYAKCGSLEDAQTVFDGLSRKDVITWTAMIAGYAQQGKGQEALSIYSSMLQEGISHPDFIIYTCLLQACSSVGQVALDQGKKLHAQIEERGLQKDVVLGSSLVNMYAKCGSVEDARRVFDRLPHRDVVTWTAMIAGYAQQGMGQEALDLYNIMQQEGITPPDSVTFVCLLKACGSVGVGALQQGKQLNAQIEERGLQDDVGLGGSLVNMYAKCGSIKDARRVFDRLPHKRVLTWTTMIAGYAQLGKAQEALNLYITMQQEGIMAPNSVTFVCLLQTCSTGSALPLGKHLHAKIEEQGLQDNVVVGGSLVDMYAKCGSLDDARKVFDKLPQKNVVAWNAMIVGYTQEGLCDEAFSLYSNMQEEGITAPDSVTFISLLQACVTVGEAALHQGKQLHSKIEEQGLQDDMVVGASLVNMYAKCGSIEDARRVSDRLPHKMW